MKKLSNGEQSLYLDCYDKGQRWKHFLDLRLTGNKDRDREVLRLAETARAQMQIDLFSGKHGLVSSSLGKLPFVEFCRSKTAGRLHLEKAIKHLETFNKTITLQAVDERFLEGFKAHLLDSGLQPATASTYLHAISLALNLAVTERAILRNPAKGVKHIKVPDKPRTHLTFEEVQRLANTTIMGENGTGGEIKRAFLFSCLTGLRWSDLVALTWGDIRDGQIIRPQVKTKKLVAIPLHPDALALIETPEVQIHRLDEPVFKLSRNSAPNRYIHDWSTRAGIDRPVTFHTARHTAGTLLLQGGAEIYTVQKILGHTKAEMTMQYAAVTDDLKKKAIDALPRLALGKKRNTP